MAKIQPEQEQLDALKEIKQKISTINIINNMIFNKEGSYQIAFQKTGKKSQGKKKEEVAVDLSSTEGKKLEKLLIQYKHALVREVEKLSKQQRILLEEDDLTSFSDEAAEEPEEISADASGEPVPITPETTEPQEVSTQEEGAHQW